jgi:hypothetical protein
MLFVPAAAVIVPAPQEPVSPLGEAIVRPAGNVSTKATPVRATELAAGFVIVKSSEEVKFGAIVEGVKDLEIEGGPTTSKLADADVPVPPWVEVTFPVTLFFIPAVDPVTFTPMVQEPFAGKLPPDKLTVSVPGAAVTVPPHTPVNPFAAETIKPEGSVSVKPTPVNAVPLLLF